MTTALLRPLCLLAGLMLVMVGLREVADALGLHAPWYLLHELTVLLLPMLFLLVKVFPGLTESERVSFVVTSGLFIGTSAIAELVAIQQRYWWFSQTFDPLSGLDLGAIPLEEFLSYPMLLNLPTLWFLWLARAQPPEALLGEARAVVLERWLQRGAGLCLVLAGVLVGLVLLGPGGRVDPSVEAVVDAAGAIRYSAGPRQYGWTLVQLLGWAGTLWLAGAVAHRLRWRVLLIVVATYFPFALFFELLACGRGWWVWNSQQTLGLFAWVLPIESFSMYLTGALMPVLCFEWLRGVWVGDSAASALSPQRP
jgi:hypothetical protein